VPILFFLLLAILIGYGLWTALNFKASPRPQTTVKATASTSVASEESPRRESTVTSTITAETLQLDNGATATIEEPPRLDFGATATIEGWVISLGQLRVQAAIPGPDQKTVAAQGRYWLVWIDARNVGHGTRSLAGDFTFVLDGPSGSYSDVSTTNPALAVVAARAVGRPALTEGVHEGTVTHGLLVFDGPVDSTPETLQLTRTTTNREHIVYSMAEALTKALATATAEAGRSKR
jgi:hypothetical protein